jgi:EXPERA (EXPanded EBP superfamily)
VTAMAPRTRAQIASAPSGSEVVKKTVASDGSSKPLSFSEKITAVWYALDACTHLTMELSYVLLTWFYNGARNFDGLASVIWKEYGKADARWENYDTNVLSLEILTVFIMGPLALACLYGTLKRSPWRHVAQIVICACELYGGFMTFAPEWLSRPVANPNLSNRPLHVCCHLFFFNFLWVLVPLILLWDSCVVLTRAAATANISKIAHHEPPSGNGWHKVIAFSLVLYVLLVPGVLVYATISGA